MNDSSRRNLNASWGEALRVLREGGVILYPTDTIWGLGCDATDPAAVERIFRIKARPEAKSLVLLVSDLDMLARYVKAIPDIALDLVEVNDRPMTIIYPDAVVAPSTPGSAVAPVPADRALPRPDRRFLAANAVAADGSVGIRIPLMPELCDMIRRFGRPIVSTSANVSGEPSPRVFADIPDSIRGAADYVVDPSLESSSTGLASQILKLSLSGEVQILRM